MEVNALTWTITILVIAGFFVFDFFSHVRTPHAPTMKESAGWSVFYIVLACIFGGFLWLTWGEPGNPHQHGVEFFAGYVTEKALSVDNLFVFALIMGAFKIPREFQQKVLLIGIALALVFRGLFIWLGAAVISAWSDVFYLFGIFLLYTALKLVIDEVRGAEETNPEDMTIIKFVRRVIPVTKDFHSDRLVVRGSDRKLHVTPLLVALISIGMIDLMFAFDSIPAIYGLTSEPYIVFTTNAFALLGLRQLYFLLDGLLDRLVYLSYGLGIILGFIGVKLILHAMHENKLFFINGGEPMHWAPEVPTVWSLVAIIGILVITTVASLLWGKPESHSAEGEGSAAVDPAGDAAAPATPEAPESTDSAAPTSAEPTDHAATTQKSSHT